MIIKEAKQAHVEILLKVCYDIYQQYEWLSSAYIADFYVDNHWKKLPQTWRNSLTHSRPHEIANIIDVIKPLKCSQVLPLSLIALRQCVKQFAISRDQKHLSNSLDSDSTTHYSWFNSNLLVAPHFNKFFWKRVKVKKQHEIEIMAKLCYEMAVKTNCYFILDVGSGLGHLSRMLSFGYGLQVCSFEAQGYLSQEAGKLDTDIENIIIKLFDQSFNKKKLKPTQVNIKISDTADGDDVLEIIDRYFGKESNLQFGIVGLHPCGNLGPVLLKLFAKSSQVKFINIVGCCYMKLSSSEGYPLSKLCTTKNCLLNYCSREVACHALESYVQKLKMEEQFHDLKIHSYRAALEKLIVSKWPELFHSQVGSVKCTKQLSFVEYCRKAMSKMNIKLEESDFTSNDIMTDIAEWKNVVIFYSLRLLIAPLIETIILLDRLLFILESGHACYVASIFNPEVSPRNHVVTGFK